MKSDKTLHERWEEMTPVERLTVNAIHAVLTEAVENPSHYSDPVAFIQDCEFTLQGLWKFSRDSKMHTHWLRIKGCTCPKMDNTDPMYFGGGKITVSDCPWHWERSNF